MSVLPKDAKERKAIPLYSGLVKYFPDALVAVAKLSQKGNDQHNPGTELHWDRAKSGDELDALMRHLVDEDWEAVAWRALANLQKKIETRTAVKVSHCGLDNGLAQHFYPDSMSVKIKKGC